MKKSALILLITLTLTIVNSAQQTSSASSPKVLTGVIAGGFDTVVKGAPYSAEAVSESVQTLADGNRISRSNSTKIFRDSEGRVRREGNSTIDGNSFAYSTSSYFSAVVPFGFQEAISIFDPVSNVRYSLNPTTKIARRTDTKFGSPNGTFYSSALPTTASAKVLTEVMAAQKAQSDRSAVAKAQIVTLPNLSAVTIYGDGFESKSDNGKFENLGMREFEGVTAEGKRYVSTIPAGAIGNERPIETVSETWYSKELRTVVYSVRTDPRFGEQTFRLVNINRNEPDRSLFSPPADYKIVQDSTFNFVTTTKPQ